MNHLTEGWLPARPDPRSSQYPLMASWYPTLFISLAYVGIVHIWSKRIRSRPKPPTSNGVHKPASTSSFLQNVIILYNVAMVFFSSYLVFLGSQQTYKLGYKLGCQESPDPTDSRTDTLVFAGYLFYISKFIEMLDTFFFLMRGKVDQCTFLHVFHHASMPPSIWWGLKYTPGGHVFTFLLLNSMIHVIMYAYYGLAAAGLYKYLWWKNYLTMAQMIQFALLIVHQGQIFIRTKRCDYPKIFPAAIVFYAIVFLYLFGNFYIQAYWRKQRLAKKVAEVDQYMLNGKSSSKPYTNGVHQNGINKTD